MPALRTALETQPTPRTFQITTLCKPNYITRETVRNTKRRLSEYREAAKLNYTTSSFKARLEIPVKRHPAEC